MQVAELVGAHDAARTSTASRALDWLVSCDVGIDPTPGRTHRATIAEALLVVLFADLLDRVPSARTYVRTQLAGDRRILLDHGAIRTVAWPTPQLPAGIEQVRRVLEPLGWRHAQVYPLPKLSMTGGSWTHLDGPPQIGQWFVSEFHPDEFSTEFRSTVERVLATSIDPLDPATVSRLDELTNVGSLPDDDAVAVLGVVASCFRRLHDMPSFDDYERLSAESAEMAWISTEGTSFNHATDRVADVAATADEERISGRPIKDTIEVSASGRVRQTAHRATMVERTFPSTDGPDVTTTVPGSFFEFIERRTVPGTGELDLAFDTSNAQGIFAMTRAVQHEHDGDATAATSGTEARIITRPALTFKVRRRRLSPKRQREFDEWLPRWSIPLDGPPLDWDEVFGRDASTSTAGIERGVVLDIGFGHGESTIQMARAQPHLDVIGIEVHDPGIMTVIDAIENEPLRHVRVVHGDMIRFLRRIPRESLRGVRIFFPDPWTKQRQHHRRLVRADVVGALTDRLEFGGELHLATDIDDYAEQMQRTCDAEPRLVGGVVARPAERPITRFEQRGLDNGRIATDLRYQRTVSRTDRDAP
ncbi:MAG: tRNA (guanosine(46)-N7)-methyltransferase TrmB [Ilumatobacter sp.]|uniref:tRNA (guanosine(46)-N7)-methyltransferase TrmB n=1 Tax=Ilumatobacter sp. TaxID=1967498 RepID=UPI00391CF298